MNELVLEALRLLLAAELRRDVTQAAEARALVDRVDALLGVIRQDRETLRSPVHSVDVSDGEVVTTYRDGSVKREPMPDILECCVAPREAAPPAADRPQPHRWVYDRRPWSGEYAFWCDGCGVWSAADGSLPEGPCPGRREPVRCEVRTVTVGE